MPEIFAHGGIFDRRQEPDTKVPLRDKSIKKARGAPTSLTQMRAEIQIPQ
jgi:hypothetical protein